MASSTARQGAYSIRLQRNRSLRSWRKQQVIDLLKSPAHECGHARHRDSATAALGRSLPSAWRQLRRATATRGVMATGGNRPTDLGPRPSRH
jgi:hypothetical protein